MDQGGNRNKEEKGKIMNRNEEQYQLTHIFDESLVPTEFKSPIGQRTGNPTVV